MHMTNLSINAVLARWNALDADLAVREVLPCCGSRSWACELAALRPFVDAEQLHQSSDRVWRGLAQEDWQEAFASHPRIGEQHARAATAESLAWSAEEQRAAVIKGATKLALAEGNRQYEERFGRIFIVCASRRSGAQILCLLQSRMGNSPAAEWLEAGEQQRQITQLRLRRWLGADRSMGISTHILDTSLGRPAAGVPVSLLEFRDNATGGLWRLIGSGHTDQDGRCKTLLGEQPLAVADYRLEFDVSEYFCQLQVPSIYSRILIDFRVSDPSQHYHVPLLLAANGYTTYRGS
jgi:2-oxo-4-hydroxy-4-carboxy-5-ureidoimidazoline decarboxylase